MTGDSTQAIGEGVDLYPRISAHSRHMDLCFPREECPKHSKGSSKISLNKDRLTQVKHRVLTSTEEHKAEARHTRDHS